MTEEICLALHVNYLYRYTIWIKIDPVNIFEQKFTYIKFNENSLSDPRKQRDTMNIIDSFFFKLSTGKLPVQSCPFVSHVLGSFILWRNKRNCPQPHVKKTNLTNRNYEKYILKGSDDDV
jgi:hypothetical protein